MRYLEEICPISCSSFFTTSMINEQVLVTNSVSLSHDVDCCKKLKIIDISPTLAEAVRRAHNGESISYLFNNVPQ